MGYNERLAALEKRVAELEVQVQAQPKGGEAKVVLSAEGLVEVLQSLARSDTAEVSQR